MANEIKGGYDITSGIEIGNLNANGILDISYDDLNVEKNLVIGGDFSTNPWQRGVSFPSSTFFHSADRWLHTHHSLILQYTVTKVADAPTVAECGVLTSGSLRMEVTTPPAFYGFNDYWLVEQLIEGYNFKKIAQNIFSLSIWVKTNQVGTYHVCLRNDGLDRYYVSPFIVNAADTWEKKRFVITASPSAGTWDFENGVGIRVGIVLHAEMNMQTATINSWTVGNKLATAAQIRLMNVLGNYFQISLAETKKGSRITRFEERSIQEELILCQRYYEKSFEQGVAPRQQSNDENGCLQYRAQTAGVSDYTMCKTFSVEKRTPPTILFFSPASLNTTWRNSSIGTDSGAAAVEPFSSASSKQLVIKNPQVVGDSAGDLFLLHWSANAEL